MRRDDADVFPVASSPPLPGEPEVVIAALSSVVTEARLARLTEVAAARTDAFAVVLEGLTDPHNMSAILRTADAFGVQGVHVIPGPHGFNAAHRVAKGSQRWLDIHTHPSPEACVDALRKLGFEIFVAAADGQLSPTDLGRRKRAAVVFGNEHAGASPETHALSDGTYSIPMQGFVESLNVSVAAAITMHAANRAPMGREASRALLARFLVDSVKDSRRIVADYEAKMCPG